MKVKILRLSHHKFKNKNLAELFDDISITFKVLYIFCIFSIYIWGFFVIKICCDKLITQLLFLINIEWEF